jgi:hypothetical protein
MLEPGVKLVKGVRDDQLADSHSIFKRLKNHFYQLLNVHGANNVRQT